MVLEFCDGGDFAKFLKKHKRVTEEQARYFLTQLSTHCLTQQQQQQQQPSEMDKALMPIFFHPHSTGDGLKYLHERSIVHRDLKPQNLLLQRRRGTTGEHFTDWVLKIADFGFARFIEPEGVASTLCGSPLYMAPEILFCQPYDAKADLWSVGAILFEMLVGR